MKWNHQFDHYYSEDRRYMIERSPYGGWDLYTKSRPDLTMYDLHVINCDLLREAKDAASSHDVEAATREALARDGMLAQEEAPAEEIAAEEPGEEAEPLPMKIYVRADGEGTTFHASEARIWHASGLDLIIHSRYGNTGVYVHGAAQKPTSTAEDENQAHCKHIAREMDAYVNGEVYRCPDCGEILHLPDDVGDRYRCPHCETVNDVDDLEQLGVWDFLSDVYDVEYRCGSDREFRSVRVMVACGGPNIYLDSASKDVELYWWNERARYPMSEDAAAALETWGEEYWSM